ncbi:MAG: FAD-binding protein [Streptosporangiales bacterium]|nr:FAD-binding protein [Streptosporangiales bacterium]
MTRLSTVVVMAADGVTRPSPKEYLAYGVAADLGTGYPCAVDGAHLAGVLAARSRGDAHRLPRPDGGRLVVVGAGLAGLELASDAHDLGYRVTVVEAERTVLPGLVSPATAAFLVDRHAARGVPVLTGTVVTRVVGADGRVVGVETDAGGVVEADLVAFTCGPRAAHARPSVRRPTPWLWSRQAGHRLQLAGRTAHPDVTVLRGDPTVGPFSRFCFRDGLLTGVESVDHDTVHRAARHLLAARHDVTMDDLVTTGFDPGDLGGHGRFTSPAWTSPRPGTR